MQQSSRSGFHLAIIVAAQFAGTSLWFAGNAIITDISKETTHGFANITSMVQFGFISGTLLFSLLTIADRFPARNVFFFSSLIAAVANLGLIWAANNMALLFAMRFLTGFFLAGIYPVGMKIAADLFPKKLGNALGLLVGALVLGTAFPHILKSQLHALPWPYVLWCTSILAIAGGLLILVFIPPKKSRRVERPHFTEAFTVFRSFNFRPAAFGYFGHMWELYTFWAFVPLIISLYNQLNAASINVPLWSFIIIGSGSLGCIAGGLISRKNGSRKVAFIALLISGICCLFSPFFFLLPLPVFLSLMLVWGCSVVADSPQFSALVATAAPQENKGTALTIVTSIGFAITILSIQLLQPALDQFGQYGFLLLLPGPVFGLWHLQQYRANKNHE
jgi:MFS family permease